jgi:hypothetical protein
VTDHPCFVAELRLTLQSTDDWPLVEATLLAATERARGHGHAIHWLDTTYLPERGVVRCTFEADAAATVRSLLDAANLPAVRIEAVADLPRLDSREGRD